MTDFFRKISHQTSEIVGSPGSFISALLMIIIWAVAGPFFHFSDTWQLVINTTTTIMTFLMVFLIQNTQNRDAKALHLKLDELIRSIQGARNTMVDLEELSDAELEKLQKQFRQMGKDYARLSDHASEVAEVSAENTNKDPKKRRKIKSTLKS